MIKSRGIQDVNKLPVALDENRPIIFLDIDGVVNPRPYERVWVGPDRPLVGGLWDPGYNDRKNWELKVLEQDQKLHYPITRKIDVDYDLWADYPQAWIESLLNQEEPKKRYKGLQLNIMDEMLDELRGLVDTHNAQVVYLTFWRSEALRLLESELRLGGISFLDWNTNSDRGHRLKIDSLCYLYEETNIRTPFVVLDDESTVGLTHDGIKLWYPNPRDEEKNPERFAMMNELNGIPKLILQQDSRWGIERAHIQQVRSFLESLKC